MEERGANLVVGIGEAKSQGHGSTLEFGTLVLDVCKSVSVLCCQNFTHALHVLLLTNVLLVTHSRYVMFVTHAFHVVIIYSI